MVGGRVWRQLQQAAAGRRGAEMAGVRCQQQERQLPAGLCAAEGTHMHDALVVHRVASLAVPHLNALCNTHTQNTNFPSAQE